MFLSLSFIVSTMFSTFTQPLTMGLTLMVQTMMTGLIMYKYSKLSWYAFISIIVMVGGLLVSFMYVAVLTPKEPTARRSLWPVPILLVPIMLFMNMSAKTYIYTSNTPISPTMLFCSSTIVTILLISFLLLALIIVVHNTATNKSPMRAY